MGSEKGSEPTVCGGGHGAFVRQDGQDEIKRRLSLFHAKDGLEEHWVILAKIKVRKNGPYLVSGEDVVLEDWEGNCYSSANKSFALCRCGASANRPFCDGRHNEVGFNASERATRE